MLNWRYKSSVRCTPGSASLRGDILRDLPARRGRERGLCCRLGRTSSDVSENACGLRMDPTTSGYSLDNRLAGIRSSRSDQAPLTANQICQCLSIIHPPERVLLGFVARLWLGLSLKEVLPVLEAASPASDRPDLKALPLRSQEVCCLVQPEKARYPFGSISTTPNPTWRKPWQT